MAKDPGGAESANPNATVVDPDLVYDPLGWLDLLPENEQPGNDNPPPITTTTTKNPPGEQGPGTSGGYSGGGGGGGGSANPGLSEYIQDYRIRFFNDGKPPADLLKKAKDQNWTLAYFEMQVRLHDPKYLRSKEAKALLPQFNRTMQILFPGLAKRDKQAQLMKSDFYRKQAVWYLRQGIGLLGDQGMELLYGRITNTRRWNQNNPYWKAFAKNRNINTQLEADPLRYKTYLETFKQNFHEVGLTDIPDDYFRTFFRSRYASEEGISQMQQNLKTYVGGRGALQWFEGKPMTTKDVKTATLDAGQKGRDLRWRLASKVGTRQNFIGSEQQGFGKKLNEREQITTRI
jgi:hypothetical protein